MNDEIREILEHIQYVIDEDDYWEVTKVTLKPLLNYITNLQQENERLKEKLNCKEYFSSTMPEDTEFVILTKNNYDRQQKDIQFELIDYKSRCEKAIEYMQDFIFEPLLVQEDRKLIMFNENLRNFENILQNGSDDNE